MAAEVGGVEVNHAVDKKDIEIVEHFCSLSEKARLLFDGLRSVAVVF